MLRVHRLIVSATTDSEPTYRFKTLLTYQVTYITLSICPGFDVGAHQ